MYSYIRLYVVHTLFLLKKIYEMKMKISILGERGGARTERERES